MTGPVGRKLDDGRLHFQHGPIDLIIAIDGPNDDVEAARQTAWTRFQTVLDELVDELPLLRRPLGDTKPDFIGTVAAAMCEACWPYRERFITPMASVAGAVADEMLEAIAPGSPLRRVMINNGGDIALYLAPGEEANIGLAKRGDRFGLAGTIKLRSSDASRGIATSGWRGRSQSLGIADAATVLARSAAEADAAATMIANAVNADHPAIERKPAYQVKEDSDLGDLLVTVEVGHLPPEAVSMALQCGELEAHALLERQLIHGAVLLLQGQIRVIGTAQSGANPKIAACL